MKIYDIAEDKSLSCEQKLDEVQTIVRDVGTQTGDLYYLSEIINQCVNQEFAQCLETAYLVSEETNPLLSSNLNEGLEAIGDADINAVNQFIKSTIQHQDRRQAYHLAKIVPHLYRGHENELASQMQDWFTTDSYFFFRATKNTLECFLEESSSHGAQDFRNEILPIKDELETIAQSESLSPSDAYQNKNYEIVKISALLSDLKWHTKHTTDFNMVQQNLSRYPNLKSLLTHKNPAIPELKQHNTHPLTKLLNHPLTKSEVQQIRDDPNATDTERRKAKQCLNRIQILTYYDHCIEQVTPGNGQHGDPVGRLRDDLLRRQSFQSTIAEIEVFNVLRRAFSISNVAIEQQAPNGKVPDATITVDGKTIWTEVTLPQPHPSYAVARRYSFDMDPEKSEVRSAVTTKLNRQIIGVKEATGDLTMLVIKNEDSRLDDETVQDYVEGAIDLLVPLNQPDAEPIPVRGQRTGLQYNNVTDHLDILVNFDTCEDLSNPPYINGQVANLTDVDQPIINRLAGAFNAQVLTPP